MKAIQGYGYILYQDQWMPLNEDKLLFPIEVSKEISTGGYNPLGFFQEFMLAQKFEHFLISYYETEIEE